MLCVCAQVESEQCAREVCEYRAALQRRRAQRVHREEGEGVPLVVKGDVVGSVEALGGVLISRQPEQLRLNVVHSGVGAISESDVEMAASSGGVFVCVCVYMCTCVCICVRVCVCVCV